MTARRKCAKWTQHTAMFVTGLLILGVFLFPFVWMVLMSFKTRLQTFAIPPVWVFRPTLENYRDLFARDFFGTYFKNSLLTVTGSVLLSLVIAAPAAYGLARLEFRRKKDVAFYILSVRMAPAIAVVIPYFLIGSLTGLLDTHIILIIAYLSFNVPFAVWMLKGFMAEIPVDVDEAAMIDGCSRFQAFWRLILPLTANGLAATAILCTIQSWNEFTFALFLTTTKARTLPTIVTQFLTFQGVVWGEMSAAATITTIPVVLFALLVRKHLISGLTFGAIKE
ncbi:MAG: carbohydrate ABC transporter permease [Betaproteobacteria bacterium]